MLHTWTGRPAWKEVDLAALRYNVALIRRHVAPVAVMAAIKADAYGHGAIPVARAVLAAGAAGLAVATVEEAVELRENDISAPILNLGWVAPEQIELALRHDVQLTVFDYENAVQISAVAARRGISAVIHIKVDTGLTRLGFNYRPAAMAEAKLVYALPGLYVEGVFSHFADADAVDPGYTAQQIERYHAFVAALQAAGLPAPVRHLANSPGTLGVPASYLDMVRPGLILFGCYPAEHMRPLLPLKLVMRVIARIAQIHTLPAGDYVGYGCRWQAQRESRIATLPLGYADGLPRLAGNKADVLIHGQRARMVGSVCMDQIMVDITDIPAAKAGDEAVIVGQQGEEMITPEELAAHAQTISDEICTRFGQRLPRVFLDTDFSRGGLSMIEKVETKYSAANTGHYSPAIKYNGILFISGQLSVDPETGQAAPGGIKAEARQALKNLELVLHSAHVTKNDVLQCRVYIPDIAYWEELNEVYAEFFGAHKPARAVIPCGQLHGGCLVEIEAIAACGEE